MRNKTVRLIAAILLLALTAVMSGCGGEMWDGYENADLTKYVRLGEWRGVRYAKARAEVTDEEVDDAIEMTLQDHAYREDVDREAVKGDYCILTYTCTVDGEKVDSLSGEEVAYSVGSVYTLASVEGFSDSVIGKKGGDHYEFDAKLSDTLEEEKLAGRTAHMDVTVNAIYVYTVPELTDELAKELSETASTADEYRAEVKAQMLAEAEEEAAFTDQETVWNLLLEGAEMVKYPESEVKRYSAEMHDYYEEYAAYYNYTLEEFLTSAYGTTVEEFEKSCTEYGQTSVKNDMVLYALVRDMGITVTDAEYNSALLRYFNDGGEELGVSSPEEYEQYYTKSVIMQTILFERVIDEAMKAAIPD